MGRNKLKQYATSAHKSLNFRYRTRYGV